MEHITTIIGAILICPSIVGEGAGAIGGIVATIGRLIDLVAAGADAAMSSYRIYEDKKKNNAPFAIFGILTDGAGSFGRVPNEINEMGKYRRGMSKDDLGKLGDTFKRNDDDIQELSKICKLKK